MKRILLGGLLLVALSMTSLVGQAGIYSDDLSRCLVASSDVQMRWMFTAIALHPSARGLANVSQAEFDAANKASPI